MDINQNLGNLLKEAQKMQQRMQEAQQQLLEINVTGEAGGRKIQISFNGKRYATKAVISPELADDIEMLQDLVVGAINDAARKLEKVTQEKISQLTAGMNLPTDLLGGGETGGTEGER